MEETQARVDSNRWLELELKYHLQLKQRQIAAREAGYGKVTRNSRLNTYKVCYADLIHSLHHW